MIITFWICVAFVAYVFLGYPLFCWLLSRAIPARRQPIQSRVSSYSIILAAHNEETRIAERITELIEQIDTCPATGELIVVSDGSTDATAAIARGFSDNRICIVELIANVGKAEALNAGTSQAHGQVLVFADARQKWSDGALQSLLANFSDPEIGGVSGELVLDAAQGATSGVGLYWRYEKWVRMSESRLSSTVGVSGSICAVRKQLFRHIPRGTVLDDVYWPLQVVLQGKRVVLDSNAVAFDRLPPDATQEFRRKVRTLAGNYQLTTLLPSILIPWRNPIWWQFVSHKLGRLIVPWAILLELVACIWIWTPFYRAVLVVQLVIIAIAAAGLLVRSKLNNAALSALAAFLLLNFAAFAAFWIWVTGQTKSSWKKTAYQGP